MKNTILLVMAACLLCFAGCRGRKKTEDTTAVKTTPPPQAVQPQTEMPAPAPAVPDEVPQPAPLPDTAPADAGPVVEQAEPVPQVVPEQTRTLDLGDGVNMDFVTMSSGQGDAGDNPEQQKATAEPYFVAKSQVTQEQWAKLMGSSPAGSGAAADSAVRVTWAESQAFLAKLKAKADGMDVRVPEQDEWERVSRAGNSETQPDDVTWIEVDSTKTPRAGFWGPYDMKGMGLVEFVKASETMTRPVLPVMAPPKQSVPTPMDSAE